MDESCDPKKDYDPKECPKYCNTWRACALFSTNNFIVTDYNETLSEDSADMVGVNTITYKTKENK